MKKAPESGFAEYRLLDTGLGRKLEQVGEYRLIRPALNAFWTPTLPESEWAAADSVYERTGANSGNWKGRLPESWMISYAGFVLKVKPTGFGHLGFFAEQFSNWNRFKVMKHERALNLFAYSGVGSMAMAQGGAEVCHVDAARGMIEWGRENLALNREVPDNIRWIVDDVLKFCRREVRRGARYSLIALDPPSFGRGAQSQVWKIEEDLSTLLEECRKLLDPERACQVFLSCHSPGFTPLSLGRLLESTLGKGSLEGFEMQVPESTGRVLPAGYCAVWNSGK